MKLFNVSSIVLLALPAILLACAGEVSDTATGDPRGPDGTGTGQPPAGEPPVTGEDRPLTCRDATSLPAGTYEARGRSRDADGTTSDSDVTLVSASSEITGDINGPTATATIYERWSFTGPGNADVANGKGEKIGSCVCATTTFECTFDVPGPTVLTMKRTMSFTERGLTVHEEGKLAGGAFENDYALQRRP